MDKDNINNKNRVISNINKDIKEKKLKNIIIILQKFIYMKLLMILILKRKIKNIIHLL